jgi:hypothetical protein
MVSACCKRLTAGLLILACGIASAEVGADGTGAPTYVTWDQMEPDKCAALWLIQRHIAPGARFLFFPAGSDSPPGILFDTPEAEIRRTHHQSTFEVLMTMYGLVDPKVQYIGRLMHDIEINIWRRKALAETRQLESELRSQIQLLSSADAVAFCFNYFEQLSVLP